MRQFIQAIVKGGIVNIPLYLANLGVVYLLIHVLHYTTVGIFSAVIVGDIFAYVAGTALRKQFMRILWRIGYYD